jgi:choline dehydrogenase
MGCPGWGYEDVLPYFRKSEHNDTFDNRYHGQGRPPRRQPAPRAAARSARPSSPPGPRSASPQPRLHGETQDGLGYYQLTQRWYRRSSTSTAFLKPALGRPNLTVKTGQQVLRIVVEKGRAVGVQTTEGTLRASTEVILSSGAIGSPRLLQLSGIGPADDLGRLGIPVVLDRPQVGANLQDHLDLFVIAECTGPHTYDRYAKPHWSALAGLQYLLTRKGPVASSLFETGGFWYADPSARSPDIQFHLGLGSGIEAGVAAMPQGGVTLNSAFLRPRSRGTVRLAPAPTPTPPP